MEPQLLLSRSRFVYTCHDPCSALSSIGAHKGFMARIHSSKNGGATDGAPEVALSGPLRRLRPKRVHHSGVASSMILGTRWGGGHWGGNSSSKEMPFISSWVETTSFLSLLNDGLLIWDCSNSSIARLPSGRVKLLFSQEAIRKGRICRAVRQESSGRCRIAGNLKSRSR